MAEIMSLRSDNRAFLGVSVGSLQRSLTESLLRDQPLDMSELLATLRQVVSPTNFRWVVRRACKTALQHVSEDLKAGRRDARQVVNLARIAMGDSRMFDELLDRLGLQHTALN